MTDDDKALEFKHTRITGQAMRDHWGPIVDRIADETADWRDEWIYDLSAENERLRDALERIESYSPAITHEWANGVRAIARAALGDMK